MLSGLRWWLAAHVALSLAISTGCGGISGDKPCEPYPKDVFERFNCPLEPPDTALAAMASINENAWGNWDTLRCNFGELRSLYLPLPDCAGEEAVQEHFWAAVEAWPEVFGMVRSDFELETRPAGLTCGDIIHIAETAENTSASYTYADLFRVAYGGVPFRAVAGVVRFSAPDGVVRIDEIKYLENLTVDEDLVAEMAQCTGADLAVLEEQLRAQGYTYLEWVPPFPAGLCSGEIVTRTYHPNSEDTVQWLDTYWTEASIPDSWCLRRIQEARLIISPGNYPDGSHNLMCWDESGEPWMGFGVSVDAVTGEVTDWQPGPGCIVC